ncbi:hypothetical protein CEUSTIGMA_g322.t1 [Chlamydomonas eustigma]|uniref:N-formylglutamate amidohydrolase n=1 Tax=Chlamydomonas eustigma TaxID=1157962 RepID=A0A250WPU7_9CHLO|nr:hypothetical protein CEUSTIGMA_g322.t1 [Chlamydomonas eustigma]|eukprot:GAX72867.1 hypothetical protein CEUSTIGMA_g322.t1 [Chlamydomonas eustigma]
MRAMTGVLEGQGLSFRAFPCAQSSYCTDSVYKLLRPTCNDEAMSRGCPILISSPHSGTLVPLNGMQHVDVSRDILTQTEDSYVDELWHGAASTSGVTMLSALFPRWYIDPNRAEDDLDPDLIDVSAGLPPGMSFAPSTKSQMGVGLIRRLAAPKTLIYKQLLLGEEVLHRIETFHRPYHNVLRSEMLRLHQKHGQVLLLDVHSMKSVGNETTPDGPGTVRPDVVLGDLDGVSCAPQYEQCLKSAFLDIGYSVKINNPYKGAHIMKLYGKPKQGWHALQVELNRGLYRVEKTREKIPDKISTVKSDLSTVIQALLTNMKAL